MKRFKAGFLIAVATVVTIAVTERTTFAIDSDFNGPGDPFVDWCERVYNMRWDGSEILGFNSNCCVSNTSGGNTGYGSCGVPAGTTGRGCCSPPSPQPGDLVCEQQGCVMVSDAMMPPDIATGFLLITRADDAGDDRTARVDVRLIDPLKFEDGDHPGVYAVADDQCIAGIESFVRRDEFTTPVANKQYQLQVLVGSGGFGPPGNTNCGPPTLCECISGCKVGIPASACIGAVTPADVFPIANLNATCTLELHTNKVGTQQVFVPNEGFVFFDLIDAKGKFYGPCVNNAVHETVTTRFRTRSGWYNQNLRRFAISGSRTGAQSLRYDNFHGSAF